MMMRVRMNAAMLSTTAFAADAFSCARAAFNTALLILDAAFAASIFVALLILVSLVSLLLNITLISLLALLVVRLFPMHLKR